MRFQFLYGAIKRYIGRTFPPLFMFNFNSFMVRLKVPAITNASNSFEFQFLYGAIKSLRVKPVPDSFENFNSFMVRLKGLSAKG